MLLEKEKVSHILYSPFDSNDNNNDKAKLIRKINCYRSLFFLALIIFWNFCVFSNYNKSESNSRYISLKKGLFFMKKCFEGEFLNNNSNSFSNESKITVVIPVYNCEKTIKAAVRSIQNQNMADIQIILVNDFSKDNTSKIIQELSEEDPRIRIINNGKNMGALYSRNIGILNAKGKYIMNLDNDDLFMDTDVFDVIYDEIEKTKFDIIGFRCVDAPSYNPIFTQIYEDYFHDHKVGLIVRQPELKYFPIERNNKFSPNDYHVWGRLVKTEVYQKAINNIGISAIGEDRKYNFLSWAEDSAMSVVLFKFAKSYKFIGKYGIFHYIARTTASITQPQANKFFGELYFFDLIFDFSDNDARGKKNAYHKAIDLRYSNEFTLGDERNVMFLKAILKKIFNCQYISEEDKNQIKKAYNGLGLFDVK
jgi:glycosyltransferase involved in cell wall biosynthesis